MSVAVAPKLGDPLTLHLADSTPTATGVIVATYENADVSRH